MSDIISKFDDLKITYECINSCGKMISQSITIINEDILDNPYFIRYLIKYANKKWHFVPDGFEYDYDCNSVVDLLLSIIKTPEDKDMFIKDLFKTPEKLIYQINLKCIDLSNIIKIYLKSEWNRVKIESQWKKYSSKKQGKEIDKLSS